MNRFFNHFTMRARIATAIVVSVVVSLIITGGLLTHRGVSQIQESLTYQFRSDLTAKRNLVNAQVSSYFKTIDKQISTMAQNQSTLDAVVKFRQAFFQTRSAAGTADNSLQRYYQNDFQRAYQANNADPINSIGLLDKLSPLARTMQSQWIADNQYPLGSKNSLQQVSDGGLYSDVHQNFHPFFNTFLESFGYYDIFLVDADSGNIVYSVYKELDFATSLVNGPYADSGIATAFKKALSLSSGETFLTDFSPYLPSYNSPASFIASPIFDGEKRVGVLIFQMPIDRINSIMVHNQQWSEQGFGASGETYLVGADGTLRSESRFFTEDRRQYVDAIRSRYPEAVNQIEVKNTSIGLQPVDSIAAEGALKGNSGFETISDYRGVEVLSAFQPIQVGDMQWAIMAEIDVAEAFAAAEQLKRDMTISTVILVMVTSAVFTVIALLLSHTLIAPLMAIAGRFKKLNSDDANLNSRLETSTIPEINLIVVQFNHFLSELSTIVSELKGHAELVAASSTELSAITEQSSTASLQQTEDTNKASESVLGFVDVSQHLQGKSQKAKQDAVSAVAMTRENSQRAMEASQQIESLASNVKQSADSLAVLSSQVVNISTVLDVINGIADQTNLLALNAAIEAARAGEHGRGFAVVADEVRTLAARTQESTVQIQQTIAALGRESENASSAMQEANQAAQVGAEVVKSVSQQLNLLEDTITGITQSSGEVSGDVDMQIQACDEVNQLMQRMVESISEMSSATQETASSAAGLSDTASQVHLLVDKFKV